MLTAAQKAEKDASLAEETAKKNLTDAEKAAADAKKELTNAMKAVDAAKADTVAVKKAADEGMAAITKSLQGAGIDPAKADEGLKKLTDAKTAAETKEKELAAKAGRSRQERNRTGEAGRRGEESRRFPAKACQASETDAGRDWRAARESQVRWRNQTQQRSSRELMTLQGGDDGRHDHASR